MGLNVSLLVKNQYNTIPKSFLIGEIAEICGYPLVVSRFFQKSLRQNQILRRGNLEIPIATQHDPD